MILIISSLAFYFRFPLVMFYISNNWLQFKSSRSMSLIEKLQFSGDNPQPRFGHTVTLIDKHRAILFGGAVGDTGRYVITGDTFLFEFMNKKFKKLDPKGIPPSSRAAHCTVFVDNCLYVFGGALGGGQLADHHLYQLDLRAGEDKAVWSLKNHQNNSPGKRYGHVMAYIRPYIVVFGGNTGNQPVNDVWTFSLNQTNMWTKVTTDGQSPAPRVYHSASICRTGSASGMMVVFGGRTTDQSALNDTWGLRKHRDGRLDWVKAPYKSGGEVPNARYQHSILFVGTLMLVVGGRNNLVGEAVSFDIYDTETSEWFKLQPIEKFRHACWIVDSYLYIHGGFDQDSPNVPTEKLLRIDLAKAFKMHSALFKGLSFETGKDYYTTKNNMKPHIPQTNFNSGSGKDIQLLHQSASRQGDYKKPSSVIANRPIRLCPQAIVASYDEQGTRKIGINQLMQQHKRLKDLIVIPNSNQLLQKIYNPILSAYFLKTSLPAQIALDTIGHLLQEVDKIISQQQSLLRLRVPIKIFGDLHGQIGDLNRLFETFGAPADDIPIGDIEATDYLFLGDYVDRGNRSLELVLLLFALKLKYPENIHLLRGAHQDKRVNKHMGFGDQCLSKLKQDLDDPDSIYQKINRIFQKLPLAAIVEKNILCVHGGLGTTMKSLSQIDQITRPLQISHQPKTASQKIAYELLWSDPSDELSDSVNTNHDYFKLRQNIKFGQNRTNRFCGENGIVAIVRSHQPIQSGVSQSGSKIINVFSCTDYCGQGNSAGIITIKRNQQIAPKILPIYGPKDPSRWATLQDFRKTRPQQEQTLRSQNPTPPKR